MVFKILILSCTMCTMIALSSCAIPMQRYEAMMRQQTQELGGLYNASDRVVVLTNANFKEMVLQQNASSLVEFYNSYCGHCKRFAPYYKELASQVYGWREVLRVGAIDCAVEDNNDVCREYEVMAYPTLRYFGPGHVSAAGAYGRPVNTQEVNEIRSTMAQWLSAENASVTAGLPNWPNLQTFSESEAEAPFEGLDSLRKYVVFVYEPENSTIGIETTLMMLPWPAVQVRRISNAELAAKYQLVGDHYKIATVDRQRNVMPYAPLADTAQSYADTIMSLLRSEHITPRPEEPLQNATTPTALLAEQQSAEKAEQQALLSEVIQHKHFVYQADLEMSLRGILFNEVPKVAEIGGERLQALKRLLGVFQRYSVPVAGGRSLIAKLYDYVMQFDEELSGAQFEEHLKHLESESGPVFSASKFVGCAPSQPGLRGFTCSVWQLFHYMTVQAANGELSQDPIEVLQAMHGYVKYFFGCTDCAEHFQSMATRRKIWSVPNKDEAVLWLWAAHNEVNQRLAGDATEDPKFPKIQFPSPASCPLCYKEPKQVQMSPANLDIGWDKDAVLQFLRNIHNPEYIQRLGLDRDDQSSLDKLRQKRMISNVFSDMDMRMGMLLYGFCILMMVVAFKLFVFKGYRKKPYGHDMLGKV